MEQNLNNLFLYYLDIFLKLLNNLVMNIFIAKTFDDPVWYVLGDDMVHIVMINFVTIGIFCCSVASITNQ